MPKPPTKKLETDGAPAPSGSPAVLGSNKQAVDALLGKPVMARALLGMTAQGEKAYAYSQSGNEIIVGFFDDIARYLAVTRTKGPLTGFSPAEISSILALNAPADRWISEKPDRPASSAKTSKAAKPPKSASSPTSFFLPGKDGGIVGWQPGDEPFVFFLQPSYPNQPHLLLNEWQVRRALE